MPFSMAMKRKAAWQSAKTPVEHGQDAKVIVGG